MRKTFIIAEAGVNHNGDVKIAKKLCDAAKEAGADAIKFQTWITEDIITKNVAQAGYQSKNTKCIESQFEMLKRLELSHKQFSHIKEYCDRIGIMFLSTADEKASLDFLVSLNISYLKVGSGDIGNIPFLRYIGSKKIPVILSTGMSNLGMIERSLNALRQGGAKDITLLHCTTNYPCPYNEVNLNAMDALKSAFRLPTGYSDHTVGIEVALAAVARGATVIEKHFTLDKLLPGPDHLASTEPQEFALMVKAIRNIETSLGNGIKTPCGSEIEISKVVIKKVVANRFIPKGKIIGEDDVCVKRNDKGIPASFWDSVVGSVAQRDYEKDSAIEVILR